jgi:FkbM family methyltransferase
VKTGRRMLIIGSGPSTKGLIERGLKNLPIDIDTFGMGAQHRFYRKANWWPTYYALADAKVVFSQRKELAEVIKDPGVTTERFFLSWPVTEHPRLKLINHASTEEFCLRKSVELGYREIYLIGVEGRYVEEIAESRSLPEEEYLALGFGEVKLPKNMMRTMRIITQTPGENPNYFFSDYQRKGDVYSLPHSHAHRARFGDAVQFALAAGAEVTNLSSESMIQDFPRADLSRIFTEPPVSGEPGASWYGPFERDEAKRLDESRIVLRLFESCAITRSPEDPVMVDVGACQGGAFSAFADRQWIVHAFEPNPALFEELRMAYDLPSVTINGIAVSDEAEQGLSFFTSEQSIGISSLSPFHETHEETARVDAIRLGDYLERAQVNHIDFLKIDAEGFDLKVLRGVDLQQYPTEVVLCEFEDSKTTPLGYDVHDMARHLQAEGFAVYVSEWYPVTRYGVRHDWRVLKKYPCALDDPKAWGNLLGFRRDPGIHLLSQAFRDETSRVDSQDASKRVVRELASVYASRSWRLTAPLRRLFSMAKKLR